MITGTGPKTIVTQPAGLPMGNQGTRSWTDHPGHARDLPAGWTGGQVGTADLQVRGGMSTVAPVRATMQPVTRRCSSVGRAAVL